MGGPAWLSYIFTAIMLAVAGYCATLRVPKVPCALLPAGAPIPAKRPLLPWPGSRQAR